LFFNFNIRSFWLIVESLTPSLTGFAASVIGLIFYCFVTIFIGFGGILGGVTIFLGTGSIFWVFSFFKGIGVFGE
jgi:hypothetical protein